MAIGQNVSQIFSQKKLTPWWSTPTQRYGQGTGGQYGTEEGTDFAVNYGTNIGSITAGKVVYVGNGGINDPSLGTIVQIQQLDGSVLHYQHLAGSNLKVGQAVSVGDIVGVSGGQRGLYSSGPHIEVRYAPSYQLAKGVWLQNWVDSYQYITSTTKATPQPPIGGSPTGTNTTTLSGSITGSASFQFPVLQLSPTDDVTQVLWMIDELMQIIPFWEVPPSILAAQNASNSSAFSQGILAGATGVATGTSGAVDIISYIEGVFYNIGADFIALSLRGGLLIMGFMLLYKVFSQFIDFGAIVSSGTQLGMAFLA